MVKSYEVVRLDPNEVHFERHGDTLSLTLPDGTRYPRVVLRCCFPVSQEQVLLSVRDANTEDQDEIGIIGNWTELRPADRQAVAAELGLHYFVPEIKVVHKVKDEFGFLYWSVETDKGPRDFVMRNNVVHFAREVGPQHWLLIDVNQARYEIVDLTKLDTRSQRIVIRALYL
jgi:hypothetical protein